MEWIQISERLQREGHPFVLVTLVEVRGSAPQIPGAKMIVTPKGLLWGTVGGGKIEAHCIRYAQELLRQEKSSAHMKTWNLQKDIGMSCGGEASFFFDRERTQIWNIALFGAGHVAQELCRVLSTWSCRVKVFDPRPEWIARLPQSPNITAFCSSKSGQDVEQLSPGTFVLSLTQGHATDVPVLEAALRKIDHFPYIGAIGSAVKAGKIKLELQTLGIAPERLEKLHCPIGLPLGDNTPPEIAISIAAQLLTERDRLPST